MDAPTKSPHSATQGSGHHAGTPPSNRPSGRSSNNSSWILLTRARKPYAATEIGMPMIAASSSADRYCFDLTTATGPIASGPDTGGVGDPAPWDTAEGGGAVESLTDVPPEINSDRPASTEVRDDAPPAAPGPAGLQLDDVGPRAERLRGTGHRLHGHGPATPVRAVHLVGGVDHEVAE